MPEYLAPGVYIEEVSFRSKSIEGVSTTTTGFIGPTRYGPIHLVPDVLTSLSDFEQAYGDRQQLQVYNHDFTSTVTDNFMWHAARAFFEEGGSTLYVVRAYRRLDGNEYVYPPASYDKATTKTNIFDDNGDPLFDDGHARVSIPHGGQDLALHVRARYPGSMGNVLVRFTINLGQNVLSATTDNSDPQNPKVKARVGGVTNNDVVWIKSNSVSAAVADAVGGGVFHIAQSTTDPVTKEPTWSFQQASSSPGQVLGLGQLDPKQDTLRVVTLTVTTFSDDPNALPTIWANIPPDPNHTQNGYPDSLVGVFSDQPASESLARTVPIVVEAGHQVVTGLDVLDALLLAASQIHPAPAETLRQALADFVAGDAATRAKATDLARSVDVELTGGNDGQRPGATEYEGQAEEDRPFKTGLNAIEDIDDISILAAPGSTCDYAHRADDADTIIDLLVTYATNHRYMIAVLDSGDGMTIADVRALRAKFDSSYAALYYPWVRILDPVTRTEKVMPPCGFVAGIYARNDTTRGVYKAPANEVVNLAIGFEKTINKAQQDVLNVEGINCFRFFEDRGYRLWGARTISSDPEWKYVNLRRYFAYLEHSIDKGTQWAVFEPNGSALWANVRRTIDDFLLNEWQAGALLGDKPEQAYFVRCDRTTMTQNDLDNGRLVCLVGVAALRPAEYVIIRIGQWTASASR
jgi:phage tail sheath protein FI